MKIFLPLMLLAVSCQAAKISSRMTVDEDEFEQDFHELIDDPAEKEKHAQKLAESEKEIEEENKEYAEGKKDWKAGLTSMSDIPDDEMSMFEGVTVVKSDRGFHFTGAIVPPESERYDPESDAYFKEFFANYNLTRGTPTKYNARKLGITSSVKNQGACGSCAAFAATAQVEACMGLAAGNTPDDLAEQEMLDCGIDQDLGNGCNGAWPANYASWVKDSNNGLMAHENSYPYTAKVSKGNCQKKTAYNVGARVTNSYTKWSPSDDEMKALISANGGVIGVLNADSFGNYKSGVFSGCTSTKINHAIQIVGYGTLNGVDYWLIKNSWGKWWGDNGYIKIKRGQNECGINYAVTVATCEKSGGATSAPVTTSAPPTVGPAETCDMTRYWGSFTLDGTYMLWKNDQYVDISCSNNVCRPLNVQYTNACKWFCGQESCAKY